MRLAALLASASVFCLVFLSCNGSGVLVRASVEPPASGAERSTSPERGNHQGPGDDLAPPPIPGIGKLLWAEGPPPAVAPEDFAIGPVVAAGEFTSVAGASSALLVARGFLEHLSNRELAVDIVERASRERLRLSLSAVLSGDIALAGPWRYGEPRSEGDNEVSVTVRYGAHVSGAVILRRGEDGWMVTAFDFEPRAVIEPRALRRFEPGRGAVPGGF